MALEEKLVKIGFSSEDAVFLASHEWFHHRLKSVEELEGVFGGIVRVYGWSTSEVLKVVRKFPRFTGFDHVRVMREVTEIYGDEDRVKKAILLSPQFAGLNHKRVMREATEIYGDEDRVKSIILNWPQFASYDHERVVKQAVEVYKDEEKVKKAILANPSFAGVDHERVMQQKSRIGRIIGLGREEIVGLILKRPVLANYSFRRDLAVVDLGRKLVTEGYGGREKEMVQAYLSYCGQSPYVPGTNRKRISQAEGEEPPLLKKMRAYLKNH